jgi:peroxiredoxin
MAETHVSDNKILGAGTTAPDFTLNSAPDRTLRLNELRGKPVVLVFYPADWSPVCGDQMALYNEMQEEFAEHNAQVLGISVDGAWCHAAFAKHRKLRFPLLSDFEPKGAVSRAYGAYRTNEGVSERALFVLDAEGVIRWSYLSPIDVNPGADGIFDALESLERGDRPKSAPSKQPEARA